LIPEDLLKPLENGHFYEFELLGCAVLTKAGERIGSVRDVLSVENNHLLVVEREKDRKEILIPFHEAICLEVKRANKEIIIDPPRGLLDLDEI